MWEALAKPARRLRVDDELEFAGGALRAQVTESRESGIRVIKFDTDESLDDVIDRIGEPPLPPYIKTDGRELSDDKSRYQTVYASQRGPITAPTPGFYFTPSILHL